MIKPPQITEPKKNTYTKQHRTLQKPKRLFVIPTHSPKEKKPEKNPPIYNTIHNTISELLVLPSILLLLYSPPDVGATSLLPYRFTPFNSSLQNSARAVNSGSNIKVKDGFTGRFRRTRVVIDDVANLLPTFPKHIPIMSIKRRGSTPISKPPHTRGELNPTHISPDTLSPTTAKSSL